ncbi:MAG: hypothetical protein JXB32_25990 [Deltaproteobacteria bacterium]|nr:hypothetical protein [Deltaproteobacteria bacterium]
MNPARRQPRGTFLTVEQSMAAASCPEAAFDHLVRLALAAAATIRLETDIEGDGSGLASCACPAIHSRALIAMTAVTAEVLEGRKEWRRRANDFVPPWPVNAAVVRLAVPAGGASLLAAKGQQKHGDSATEAA